MNEFLASLVGRRFWIPAYAALAAGFLLPGDWRCLAPATAAALGGILFFACLRLPWGEVASGLAEPGRLRRTAWMTALKLLVLPLAAWTATLAIDARWAAGVLLIMAMPAGLSSIALTDVYRGDRALALGLIVVSSTLCAVTVPALLIVVGASASAAAGTGHALDFASQSLYLLALVLVPFAAAQGVRACAPGIVRRGDAWWPRASIACLCLMILVAVLGHRDRWADNSHGELLLALALASLSSAIAFASAWAVRRALAAGATANAGAAITFGCAVLYMNNGLAVAYAARFHDDDARMLLPAVLMQVPMLAATALWGRLSAGVPAHDPRSRP